MITKSDFRLYLEAPRHLWAKKHQQWQETQNDFQQKLSSEGEKVEKYAQKYLQRKVIGDGNKLEQQRQFVDGEFLSRVDALIYKKDTGSYDLYEIKSSTYDKLKPKLNKMDLYDLTFQALIAEEHIKIDQHYLLLLNANYIRQGKLNLEELFVSVLVSEEVKKLKDEVKIKRTEAVKVGESENYLEAEACFSPKKCGCPLLCHRQLPEHNIYQIFYNSRNLMKELRKNGIIDLLTMPKKISLSDNQNRQMKIYRDKNQDIEVKKIKKEISQYEYPLYFFDYETNMSSIPQFDGQMPYQNQAVQYSLHIVGKSGKIEHREYIHLGNDDPMKATLKMMLRDIGEKGTILVWNESFEKGVNEKAAISYPEMAVKLLAANVRIQDLANAFKNKWYLDRNFRGSWSIKNVLPVLCPELSYQDLEIGKGDVAMMQWVKMNDLETSEKEKGQIKKNLLEYCQLDTWAMVRIWEELGKVGK